MSAVPRLHAWVFSGEDALRRAVLSLRVSETDAGHAPAHSIELLPVSTCQRHELFALTAGLHPAPAGSVRTFEGADAAVRLFEIASGAASSVPGEEAVAAQVRAAARRALKSGLAKSTMAKLTRRALRAGDELRARVREQTPILELPDILASLVGGRIILLGAGALGRSIHHAMTQRGMAPAIWATRRPLPGVHRTLASALRDIRSGDTVIAALSGAPNVIDAQAFRGVHMIDLGEPPTIAHAQWTLADVVEGSQEQLVPQTEAVKRAAHRLPARAEAALAECICPSIKSLNRAIHSFRTNIVEAELSRLGPLLARLDEPTAESVRRSIRHSAARSAHPLHEYVNALGRQGRAADAQLLIDHILGSRIGIGGAPQPRRSRKGTS